MKILITSPSLNTKENISGISSIIENIILNNKDHEYFHFTIGRKDGEKKGLYWILKQFKVILSFFILLKKEKINYVHLNVPFESLSLIRDYFLFNVVKFYRIPILLHVHGGVLLKTKKPNRIQSFIIKDMIQKSNVVVVLSNIEKQAIKKYTLKKTIRVIPNAINIKNNERSSKSKENKLKIVYLGRLDKDKGIYDILEALDLIKNEIQFDFVLCGTGPEMTIIERLKAALHNHFIYKGVVFGSEKEFVINNSDIFILLSYYEGLPMALLETMAAGVIPVVTDVGSISTVVKNGYNGIIVEKRNPKEVAMKLKTLYFDKNLRYKLAENAKQTILLKYDINKYILKLNRLYIQSFKS